MRLATLLAALLMLSLCPVARAESTTEALLDRLPLGTMEEISAEFQGPDVRQVVAKVLAGEASPDGLSPRRALSALLSALREALLRTLTALAPPVIASLAVRLLLPGRRSGALALLCRVGCACALAEGFSEAAGVALRAMRAACRVSDAVTPVLSAALSIAGSEASAAALSPLTALCAGLIEHAFIEVGLPLCGLAALVGCAGNLSEGFRLDRLSALLKQAAAWSVGILATTFAGLMAVEGRLASAQDTVASRVLRQSVRGLLPVIGGQLSDTAGALAGSVGLLRNAVGLAGALLAGSACLRPVVRLAAYMLSVKLASAAAEPLTDPGTARVIAGFSDAAQMLLALAAGSAALVLLLVGTASGLLGP